MIDQALAIRGEGSVRNLATAKLIKRSLKCSGCCFTWLVAIIVGNGATAQIKLDRLFPPAVAAGEETSVKAEGKFPVWPPTIICDRDDVHLSAAEEGVLRVSVDAASPPGVAWIRLHDNTGATELTPLLIEPIPVLSEKEPNDRIAQAIELASPAVVGGRLEKSGDVDTFRVSARQGQNLIVSLVANQVLRAPMDAVLQLVDADGHVLMQTDDDRGLDPQIVFPVPSDGEFLIRVFAFPETPNSTIRYAGDASYVYVLRATTDSWLDHFLPLVDDSDSMSAPSGDVQPNGWSLPPGVEVTRKGPTGISPATLSLPPPALGWQWQPSVSPRDAQFLQEQPDAKEMARAIRLPFVFSGHIAHAGEVDRILFQGSKGKRYLITVESKRFGFPLDSVVRLVDPKDGSELRRNDDRARRDYDAALEYEAQKDGEIELQISDLVDGFGPRHAYSLIVREAKPDVVLEVSNDRFTLKPGDSAEVPVSINRIGDFDLRTKILAEGLPADVICEPVISESKGDTSKSVKLKLVAAEEAQPFQGEFRIVGQPIDSDKQEAVNPKPATYKLREAVHINQLWLTVVSE